MSQSGYSSTEIRQRGEALYEQALRAQVETRENVGNLISIDIQTGNYEIGSDKNLEAPRRLRLTNPDAVVYTRRIGFNAAFALGGVLERTAP